MVPKIRVGRNFFPHVPGSEVLCPEDREDNWPVSDPSSRGWLGSVAYSYQTLLISCTLKEGIQLLMDFFPDFHLATYLVEMIFKSHFFAMFVWKMQHETNVFL